MSASSWAAPLFYLVGTVVGLIKDNQRKKSQRLYGLVLLPLLLSSLEGITPALTFGKREQVTVTRSLAISIVAAILGLSSLQEFVVHGGGTPFPYDPPKRLVRSGIYAYVRNPMQLSTSLLFVIMAVGARSIWLAIAALVSVAYAEGFARWDEGRDLADRFGDAAERYARAVRRWLPSWLPEVQEPSTIYFAMSCDPCSNIAAWLQSRKPLGLRFVPAEAHPILDLERVRYESQDGTFDEGVAAIARALEHINLFWAFLGFSAQLPLVRPILQLIIDAVGGEKRRVKSEE